MKGIVLAGGTGSRLRPVTNVFNKHLMSVYDKPMIYYPIATLMAAGIRDILIISGVESLPSYKALLGDGSKFGLTFSYAIQNNAAGISEAFEIGTEFIGKENCALILGDNLFHGTGLGRQLMELENIDGCRIFAHRVANPSNYGIVNFDESGNPIGIIEKPVDPTSNYAIPGLYFFDNRVIEFAKGVKPSPRGEKEITDVLNLYLAIGALTVTILPRGTAWLDTGTFDALLDAATYVRLVEERQGYKIACLEEIAWRQGWISTDSLQLLADQLIPSPYGFYLIELLKEESTRQW